MITSSAIGCNGDDAEGAALRDRREREGKCLSCGATTHKHMFTKSGAFGLRKKMKKVPLTLAGQCKDGRCLICNPLVPTARPVDQPPIGLPNEITKEVFEGVDLLEEVASNPVLVIGEDIIIEGCEGMDPALVERIVAEEVERILAETQGNGVDDNISQAIDGMPLEIQIEISEHNEADCCTKEENDAQANRESHPVTDPQITEDHLCVEGSPPETPEANGHLAAEFPFSIEVPSPGEHKRYESAPAVLDQLQHDPLIIDGAHDGEHGPPNQHGRVMNEHELDVLDNGSLAYTCGDTYADFALISVSDDSEEDTRAGSGPSLPSREVLDEIHGLARAFDHRMAHRHLVKLRTLSIQYQRRVEISKAGGVQAIISSLKRFGKDSKATAKQAFAALQNLASIDNIARSIAQNKGIPAIVEAMETHYKCPGVQEHGCAALRNLTSSNVANRTQVGEAGGIRTIIGAMRYHAESAKICDKAVAALGNLSLKHPENRRTIGMEGGIAAILHAMRKHDGHEGVSEKGMCALWDLAHNLLNVELLKAEEGVEDFILGVGVRFRRRCKEKAVQIYLKL